MKVQNHLSSNKEIDTRNALFSAQFRTIIATLIVIAAILSIIPYVNASVLKETTIIDNLQTDLSVSETIILKLENNTDTTFLSTLPSKAENIRVNGVVSNNTVNSSLNCTSCNIEITYTIIDAIKNDGINYVFSRTLNLPKIPQKQSYQMILPVGYTINMSDGQDPKAVPKPTHLDTDGEHIIVIWQEDNPQLPKQYYISYKGTESSENLQFVLGTDVSHGWIIMICIAVLALGFAAGYFTRKILNRWQEELPKEVIPSSVLSPDEKTVMKYLKDNGASKTPINQKEIGKSLVWSKSKVSAVLTNLYYKKLIDREKFGRNYKIKLLKEMR